MLVAEDAFTVSAADLEPGTLDVLRKLFTDVCTVADDLQAGPRARDFVSILQRVFNMHAPPLVEESKRDSKQLNKNVDSDKVTEMSSRRSTNESSEESVRSSATAGLNQMPSSQTLSNEIQANDVAPLPTANSGPASTTTTGVDSELGSETTAPDHTAASTIIPGASANTGDADESALPGHESIDSTPTPEEIDETSRSVERLRRASFRLAVIHKLIHLWSENKQAGQAGMIPGRRSHSAGGTAAAGGSTASTSTPRHSSSCT